MGIWSAIQTPDSSNSYRVFSIPLGLMESIKLLIYEINGELITIKTKDCRGYLFNILPEGKQIDFCKTLQRATFHGEISDDSFM